ncbi:MAG TPA: hypothetical protein PKH51_04400, partial [Candidatus Sumerlaeota bacterium]|nr:hypothetical protein [Candidatus Sumerlaeota bacterium]
MTDRKRWQPSAPREQEPNLDLVAIALTPLTILLQGHSFGLGNYDTLLTFIRRINDYTFLSGDWMLTTPPTRSFGIGFDGIARLGVDLVGPLGLQVSVGSWWFRNRDPNAVGSP